MLDDFELLTLRAPAGAGQENDPGDIEALDLALRRARLYEPPPEYAAAPQRYATEPMIDAVKRLQSENALKVDGYALPGGPTERAINNALLAKPRGAGLLVEPLAPLTGPVGDGFANARADVATVQRGLGALGYGPEDPFDRPHGFIDAATLGGVERFQRDRGLTADGWLAPRGETERALHESLTDLARAKGPDWLAYAGRAGRAQAPMNRGDRLSPIAGQNAVDLRSDDASIGADESLSDMVVPAAYDPRYLDPSARRLRPRLESGGSRHGGGFGGANRSPFARSRSSATPSDSRLPTLGEAIATIPGLGLYAAILADPDRAGRRIADEQRDGTKVENIPPDVPNEPFRGPDPARPPLDPREASPAPYPAQPPKPAPEKVENIPPRVDPRDGIETFPDGTDERRAMPNVFKSEILRDARIPDGKDFYRRHREWLESEEGRRIRHRHENDGVRYPVAPSESLIWKGLQGYHDTRGIKTNGLSGKDRRYYTYDYGGHGTHRAQIEVWNYNGDKHLGAIDPVTGEFVHGPDKSKKPIDISSETGTDDRNFA